MGISIVIPTWEGKRLLETLFASLAMVHFSDDDEIIVADGNSSDGTQEFVRSVAEESSLKVKLVALYNNFGFAGNVNAGLQEARQKNDVVIMNNDVVIPDPSVSRMHALVKRGECGVFLMLDAGSSNGTTVNGISVLARGHGPPSELKPGDNVRLGRVESTFLDARSLQDFVLQTG